MNNVVSAVLRGLALAMVLLIVSLPALFALHRAFDLPSPPAFGLLLLGGALAVSLAVSGGVGAVIGRVHGNAVLAALAGLAIGITVCVFAAPLYGGIVVEGISHDATGLMLGEQGRLEDTVRSGATSRASDAVEAVRRGRLNEELSRLQAQARGATTKEARAKAEDAAIQVAEQLTSRGVTTLEASAARLSAFGLLVWALVASPLFAAWECRLGRRRR